jgi:UDP-3-O-[3-hydroxymyristoyl] glucosamine N-acyltransferase
MQATLAELAAMVGGHLTGKGDVIISGAASLYEVESGQITMVDQAEKNRFLENCRAAAVIAPRSFTPQRIPAIQVDDVHRAFSAVVRRFRPPRKSSHSGVSPLAAVSPTARLGKNVTVHPFATIGDDVTIGDG